MQATQRNNALFLKTSSALVFLWLAMAAKILYLSKNKLLGGVCGGFAEYLDADPTLVRLAWVVLSILSLGAGVALYLIAWLIMPDESGSSIASRILGEKRVEKRFKRGEK